MASYDVDILHRRILRILMAVDTACREHNLRYYIWAGTMIGAVRHHGFIPWDDDIDICMPRPDYEQFIAHSREWLPEPFEFVCAENDRQYPLPFGKVQDASTTLIERTHLHYLGGIYIDVFPIDGVPAGAISRKWHFACYEYWKRVLYLIHRDPYKHGHGPSSWVPLLCRRLYTMQGVQQNIRQLLLKYDYEKSPLIADYDDGLRGVLEKKVLGTPTPYAFEDETVLGVEQYDTYLSHKYGDYMTIPDGDHQRQHHFHVLDFDKSYRGERREERLRVGELCSGMGGERIQTFNLKSEERNGYVVSREMKEVWQVEMDLLKALLEVCHKHGLRCWVDGGTMLGAVRHHGFIPWDDDIDVCMPREDYDKLLAIGTEAFREPYFLQTAYSDKGYFRGHAQLRHSQTAAIRPSDSYRPYNQGIFVDIFVLDAVPADTARMKAAVKQFSRTSRFLKAKDTQILISGRLGLVFRKLRAKWAVRKRGWAAIFREAEDQLRQLPDDGQYWAELGFSGDSICFDKHIFDDTVWMDFEDMKVPVPKGYDKFLRTQYGDDYMTPVKAPSYHGEVVFDTHRNYEEVLPEVRRQYKRMQIRKLFGKK